MSAEPLPASPALSQASSPSCLGSPCLSPLALSEDGGRAALLEMCQGTSLCQAVTLAVLFRAGVACGTHVELPKHSRNKPWQSFLSPEQLMGAISFVAVNLLNRKAGL